MDPLNSIALIYQEGDPPRFCGTCFAFSDSAHFITAVHCIPVDRRALILCPQASIVSQVVGIHRHPSADLAIVQAEMASFLGKVEPFQRIGPDLRLGQDFIAFGFPEDEWGPNPGPTPRLFKGYSHRFMHYASSTLRYEYDAMELNIACPQGLSGGPLFTLDDREAVVGLVTEDVAWGGVKN